ncbi:hypothetical protein TNCV_1655701 [Trichonephila clavipes]|nr:hypothetical protein TNCV_1655701 [Trichonephila clavipes]
MSPYPFSPKKSYRTTGLIACKRSDRNANGRRARKSIFSPLKQSGTCLSISFIPESVYIEPQEVYGDLRDFDATKKNERFQSRKQESNSDSY